MPKIAEYICSTVGEYVPFVSSGIGSLAGVNYSWYWTHYRLGNGQTIRIGTSHDNDKIWNRAQVQVWLAAGWVVLIDEQTVHHEDNEQLVLEFLDKTIRLIDGE